MESVFLFFIFFLFFGVLGMFFYRYRHQVRRWLKDSRYGQDWHISRETVLKRDIEDAQAELDWLVGRKAETGES